MLGGESVNQLNQKKIFLLWRKSSVKMVIVIKELTKVVNRLANILVNDIKVLRVAIKLLWQNCLKFYIFDKYTRVCVE